MIPDGPAMYPDYDSIIEPGIKSYPYSNVHENFVMWFTWGFFNYIIILVLRFISWGFKRCDFYTSAVAFLYLSYCMVLSVLAWYITGLVLRYGPDGKFASGDTPTWMPVGQEWTDETWRAELERKSTDTLPNLWQYDSGSFMNAYFIASWVYICIRIHICGILCCFRRPSIDKSTYERL